jgi:hypothetical protein
MKKETRFKFNGYLTQLAKLNGVSVSDIASKYTAEPSVAQTLETKIQESSSFLQKINIVPVDEQSGERLGLGIGSSIAGNTDTTQKTVNPLIRLTSTVKGTSVPRPTLIRRCPMRSWIYGPNSRTSRRASVTPSLPARRLTAS